jgi:hypothetical protein
MLLLLQVNQALQGLQIFQELMKEKANILEGFVNARINY